eukprot:Sspe_Gene.28985::Locus_13450_Transcript_1_1_Confidence_1.000_Length_926::g.28985::m.28985
MKITAVSAAAILAVALLLGILRNQGTEVSHHVRMAGNALLGRKAMDRLYPEKYAVISADELSLHGSDAAEVWLAIGGKVYDVTPSKDFYGEAGWYRYFTGRDASRVFVTGRRIGFDFDANLPDGTPPYDITTCTVAEMCHLLHYVRVFDKKYRLVGLLDGEFFNSDGSERVPRQLIDKEYSCEKEGKGGEYVPREAGEESAFVLEEDEENPAEKKSKCPVMRTTQVVKEVVQRLAGLLLAPPDTPKQPHTPHRTDFARNKGG